MHESDSKKIDDLMASHEQDSLKIDQMLAQINDLTAQLKRADGLHHRTHG